MNRWRFTEGTDGRILIFRCGAAVIRPPTAAWLKQHGITAVGLEVTGMCWMPVRAALQGGGFDFTVANAQHIKAVPGRKTDIKDAEWLASLVRHGLLRKMVEEAVRAPPRRRDPSQRIGVDIHQPRSARAIPRARFGAGTAARNAVTRAGAPV